MKPRFLLFTTVKWDNDFGFASYQAPRLVDWEKRARALFDPAPHLQPVELFLAGGCQDNPEFNPLKHLTLITSGEPKTEVYDIRFQSYFLCAFTAALWHAQLHWNDCRALIEMESDVWPTPAVLGTILEFLNDRPELIMAPGWMTCPDFNFLVMKPAAISRFLHHRRRANIIDAHLRNPQQCVAEQELAEIFKGQWWNPWPDLIRIRQEFGIASESPSPDHEAGAWPLVALPSPAIKSKIEKELSPHEHH